MRRVTELLHRLRGPERARRLSSNDGGAITAMGLGAGVFLVGSMFWMIGIGDALVHHHKMQETADALTGCGSAVHARGMNLISTLNLVMLVVVAIYIALCVIYDMLVKAVYILIGCSMTVYGAAICGPMIGPTETARDIVGRIRDVYSRVMKPILTGLSIGETAAAVVVPITSQVASIRLAIKYRKVGVSFSPSLIPAGGLSGIGGSFGIGAGGASFGGGLGGSLGGSGGGGLGGSLGSLGGFRDFGFSRGSGGRDMKLGLPVAHVPMGQLCTIVGDGAPGWFQRRLTDLPGIGPVFGLPGISGAIRGVVRRSVGDARGKYCDDMWWDRDGPVDMWSRARNGNDWMQSWSFVLNKKRADQNERLVGLAVPGLFPAGPRPRSFGDFFAQSEMFFDCPDRWVSDRCNGRIRGSRGYDHAIYALRWGSRLRRFRPPSIGEFLGGFMQNWMADRFPSYVNQNVGNLDAVGDLRDRVTDAAGDYGGDFGRDAAGGAFDWLVGKADDQLDGVRSRVLGTIPGGGSGPTSLVLH